MDIIKTLSKGTMKEEEAKAFWSSHKDLERTLQHKLNLGDIDFNKFKTEILKISSQKNINPKFSIESFMEQSSTEMVVLTEQLGPYIDLVNKLNLQHLNNEDHYQMLAGSLASVYLVVTGNPEWFDTFLNSYGQNYRECVKQGVSMITLSDAIAHNIGVHNYGVLVDLSLAAKYGSNLAVTFCCTPKIVIICGGLPLLPFFYSLSNNTGIFFFNCLI